MIIYNYLESNYPNWQKPISTRTSTNTSNEYDRLAFITMK